MNKLNVLISYATIKDFPLDYLRSISNDVNILFDSGAFTAYTQGKQISLEEYLEFIRSIDFPHNGYFTLDVIGNYHATWKNFKYLIDKGVKPIPIFTRGDRLERLNVYYTYSDLVALGGLRSSADNPFGYIKHVMDNGVKGRKVHWLGNAKQYLMNHYKPFSVDVSTWYEARRFGRLKIWNGRIFLLQNRRDFLKNRTPTILKMIDKFGFNSYLLWQEKSWRGTRSLCHQISIVSWLRYMEDVKKLLGTQIYLVVSHKSDLDFLINVANKYYLKGGKDE